ncbi:MAG: hypothetical protein IPH33_12680 [Bacteroidetes bacterium]|nr:hypothetical protein [Bacteroidota bacterium]
MFTTSRLAYSSSNFNLCTRFFNHIFERVNGNTKQPVTFSKRQSLICIGDPYVRNPLSG